MNCLILLALGAWCGITIYDVLRHKLYQRSKLLTRNAALHYILYPNKRYPYE